MDFDKLLGRADLVLTAEGRTDCLTASGKMPGEIARRAKRHGVPVVVLAGEIRGFAETLYAIGIDAYFSILLQPCSRAEAMRKAPKHLAHATEQVVRLLLATYK